MDASDVYSLGVVPGDHVSVACVPLRVAVLTLVVGAHRLAAAHGSPAVPVSWAGYDCVRHVLGFAFGTPVTAHGSCCVAWLWRRRTHRGAFNLHALTRLADAGTGTATSADVLCSKIEAGGDTCQRLGSLNTVTCYRSALVECE